MFSWCIRIYTVCKTSVLFCKTERVQNAPGYNNHYSWICVKVIMHQSRFVIVIITAYSTLQQQGNISFCLVIVECATLRQTCQSQTMLKGTECTWQIFRHYVNTPIHMYWNLTTQSPPSPPPPHPPPPTPPPPKKKRKKKEKKRIWRQKFWYF